MPQTVWTDPVLTPAVTPNKSAHITELRAAVNVLESDSDDHLADYILHPPYGGITSNTGNAYTIAFPAISSLLDGMGICVEISATNTGAATFKWGGTGVKSITNANGEALEADELLENIIVMLRYNSSLDSYQMVGGGGGSQIQVLYGTYQHLVTAEEAGTTVITISGTYSVGTNTLTFYLNGIKQDVGNAYTELSSSSIQTTSGLLKNDFIDIVWVEAAEYVIASHNTTHFPGGGDDISGTYLTKEDYAVDQLFRMRW